MVVVVGQREIAREVDFDAVAFANGHRGHDIEKFVEDLGGRLSRALRESLTHQITSICREGPTRSGLGYGA